MKHVLVLRGRKRVVAECGAWWEGELQARNEVVPQERFLNDFQPSF